MKLFPRFSVSRPNWLLIVGPDLSNNDYGLTLKRGPAPPVGEWKQWRDNWRINIRWPIQITRRRSYDRRWLRRKYCVTVTDNWTPMRLFWTPDGAIKYRDSVGLHAHAFKWHPSIRVWMKMHRAEFDDHPPVAALQPQGPK